MLIELIYFSIDYNGKSSYRRGLNFALIFLWYSSMKCSIDAKQPFASILDISKLHRNSLNCMYLQDIINK